MIELFRQLFGATVKFCATDYTYTEERDEYINAGNTILNMSNKANTLRDLNNSLYDIRFKHKRKEYLFFIIKEDSTNNAFKQAKDVIKSLELRFETGYIKGKEI